MMKDGTLHPMIGEKLRHRADGTQGLEIRKGTGPSLLVSIMTLIGISLAVLLFDWYTLLTFPQTFTILVGAIIFTWVVEALWRVTSKRKVIVVGS